jgi:multiple sugar transport system ATP-binding protein
VRPADGVSLTVEPGEIVAVFGPSGSGKTVLLRMIAGMFEPDQGDILVDGRSIVGAAPERRGIGMAFQNFALFPHMTARDNIASGLGAKATASDTASRVEAISRLLKIEHVLGHAPRELSNGQKQRTALARALVRDADLYLLDEPMGQLEPQLRAVLRGRIKNLLAEREMTAIFVTHDQTEASALADRIAVMEDGVLQQFASEKELKNRPANLFVASFIGEPPMNLLAADVAPSDGGFRLSIGSDITFQIRGDTLDRAAQKALGELPRVRVGIRPQKIAVGTGDVRVRVVSNQWLGDQSHIAGECAGNLLIAVTPSRIAARPGDTVQFALEPRHLHIFGSDGACIRHAEVS